MYSIIFPNGSYGRLDATTFADAEIEARDIIRSLDSIPKGARYFVVPTGTFAVYTV